MSDDKFLTEQQSLKLQLLNEQIKVANAALETNKLKQQVLELQLLILKERVPSLEQSLNVAKELLTLEIENINQELGFEDDTKWGFDPVNLKVSIM